MLYCFSFLADGNSSTGAVVAGGAEVALKVDIPCPGHSPLIKNALKSLDGVKEVRYKVPDVFAVIYDSNKISEQEILSLSIFEEYPARVV